MVSKKPTKKPTENLTMEQDLPLIKCISEGRKAKEEYEKCNDEKRQLELHQIIAKGECASKQLAQANLGLVAHVARIYLSQGLDHKDLIQEGNIGLLRAVEKFDDTRNCSFSAFAAQLIHQAINKALPRAQMLRLPARMVKARKKYYHIRKDLFQRFGREPSPEQLVFHLGLLDPQEIELLQFHRAKGAELPKELSNRLEKAILEASFIQNPKQQPLSLEAPLGEEGTASLVDSLKDENAPTPMECPHTRQRNLSETLESSKAKLNELERLVIEYSFGEKMLHRKEIAQRLGLKEEREVDQIRANALRRLRHPQYSHQLSQYL